MTWLQSALFVARKDLGFLLRQKETLLWVFAMPVLFFYFIGTVTGGFAGPGGSGERGDPLALRGPVDDVIGNEIVRRLEEQGYRISRPTSADEFEGFARRLTIVPPSAHRSLSDAVHGGAAVVIRFERRGDPLAAGLDRFRVTRAVYAVLADLMVMRIGGETIAPESFRRLADAPRRLTLATSLAGRRLEPPTGFAQAIPGTMVMFTMLVLLTSGAILLVIERRQGLLRRLASTPIAPGAIILGKWTARMALALVQVAFAMVVGRVLFAMNWGGSLPMVLLVLVAWAAFNASLALLLGNLARSQAQAAGVGVLSTMALAALGGCWWPIEITPAWMQSLALALPSGWTMDAMHKLVSFGDPAVEALPHVAALALSALLVGWAGARGFRYT